MATLSQNVIGKHLESRRQTKFRRWDSVAIVAIVGLALFLNLYQLDRMGYGNSYYAAAVQSMAQSWHAFFYGALDSAGFITVDKPPVALWVQALSVRLFGFSSWSLIVPEALAGVASVLIVWHLVRRRFGRLAGVVAALALTLTPISVAVQRTNNLDSMLVLVLLLATWAMITATERGSLRWLLASVALVGVGFNIKMLQAWMIAPALYALHLVGTRLQLRQKIVHLAAATLVLFAVSLSWATVVDLTPADQRPYIGGSSTNSVFNLLLEYNGIGRITGENNGPGGQARPNDGTGSPPNDGNFARPNDGTRGQLPAGGPNGAGGPFNSGSPGITRLFSQEVGTQASWLIPLGIVALVLGWRRVRVRHGLNRQGRALVLWGTWLLTDLIVFSFASGIFHSYYLSSMAPAAAALFGIGVAMLWRQYRRGGWRGWLLPVALTATAALQVYLVRGAAAWSVWLLPLIGGATATAVIGLVLLGFRHEWRSRWGRSIVMLGVVGLLIAPAAWSITPVFGQGNAALPQASPDLLGSSGVAQMPFGNSNTPAANTQLLAFLQANRNGETYLVATQGSMSASPLIIASKQAVLAMGGFNGGDPAPTLEQFQTLVKTKQVRYVLTGGMGGRSSSGITSWVTQQCSVVDQSLWKDANAADTLQPSALPNMPSSGAQQLPFGNGQNPPMAGNFGGANTLYDCGNVQ